MSTLTQDFAAVLENSGFGTIGTDIFVSDDTYATTDAIITLTNLGSSRPDVSRPAIDMHYSEIQVVVRGTRGGYQACEDKADAIRSFLRPIGNYSVNDSTFVYIDHQAGQTDLGLDSKMRPRYSIEFSCLRGVDPLY